MGKVFPFIISSLLCTLSQKYLLRLSILFLSNNIEGSKRTTTRIGHFSSSTKNKQNKKQKKDTNYDRKFVVKQQIRSLYVHYDSNPWGKTCGIRRRNETMTHTFRNARTVDNMLLKPMPSEPYKWVGYWDSKGGKSATSRVNIYCLHLIKP